MAAFNTVKVLSVHHWNDSYFSFTTEREDSLRFDNGQFVMVGLMADGKPLMRAYSIASANYDEYLEFLSIKVPNGPLTSRLQHIKVGDDILISKKPTGTLVLSDLNPGRNVYLLGTGTGLAPFLSLVKDPELYDSYEKVVLVHGVRHINDLCYYDRFVKELPEDEFLGDYVREKLIYYPMVTREAFVHQGRITKLMTNGQLFKDTGLPVIDPKYDRAMLCGSTEMLRDTSEMLDNFGLKVSPKTGVRGDYVIERAFVEQ